MNHRTVGALAEDATRALQRYWEHNSPLEFSYTGQGLYPYAILWGNEVYYFAHPAEAGAALIDVSRRLYRMMDRFDTVPLQTRQDRAWREGYADASARLLEAALRLTEEVLRGHGEVDGRYLFETGM